MQKELRVKTGWMASGFLMLGLMTAPLVRAEPPTGVQIEVNYLLDSIAGSGCEFYRNGSWHDSKAARAHVRDKYEYLVARDLVHTTEQFIDRAASQSSLSGRPYEIRCNGGAAVTSGQWLRDKLAQFRDLAVDSRVPPPH
jgi:hypothetical protein